MSGGSYNYLCSKDAAELLSGHHSDLREMADTLASLGYAKDAAVETEELLLMLRQFDIRIQTRVDRLRGVWKAVEWWKSGDWGEDDVHETLAKYRGEPAKPA